MVVLRVNTLFKSKLINELRDSQRGNFDDTGEIDTNIKHIHSIAPLALKLIKLPNGTIVKMAPKYKKSEFRREVENYIQKLESEQA